MTCLTWPTTRPGTVSFVDDWVRQAGSMRCRAARVPVPRFGFAGFRSPPEVIMVAVRWYPRYGLSYRNVEELLAEPDIIVDHVKPPSCNTA